MCTVEHTHTHTLRDDGLIAEEWSDGCRASREPTRRREATQSQRIPAVTACSPADATPCRYFLLGSERSRAIRSDEQDLMTAYHTEIQTSH